MVLLKNVNFEIKGKIFADQLSDSHHLTIERRDYTYLNMFVSAALVWAISKLPSIHSLPFNFCSKIP